MTYKIFISLCVLAVSHLGYGQYTFNKRYFIEFATYMHSIHPTSDGFVMSSSCYDTIGGLHIEFGLTKINPQGNLSTQVKYGEMQRDLWTVEDSYSEQTDLFVQTSIGMVNDTNSLTLSWYNASCDTLFTRYFRSPLVNSGNPSATFINPSYSYLRADSTAYLSFTYFNAIQTATDAMLLKLDPQGNELWRYVHATMDDLEFIQTFTPHGDGVIIGLREGGNIANANHLIKKLNAQGQVDWTIDSNDYYPSVGRLEDMIIDNDTLVVTGNNFDPAGENLAYCSIYKVDTLGNLIWSNTFGEPDPVVMTYFTNLVQTTDGNYVAAGSWGTYPGSEEIPEGHTDQDIDFFAFLVKFDRNTGEIIWERKYRYLEIYWDHHWLMDMKATPDGGVIFCGESADQLEVLDTIPYQQGWVVKLDGCGCLVPGCDENCVVGVEENLTQDMMKIGPIPASDFLNIYIANAPFIDVHSLVLKMYDINGKMVYSSPIKNTDVTYMLDVAPFANGPYIVSLSSKDGVIQSERVVVEK
jgi:outer membrane protein assembly factor BamB